MKNAKKLLSLLLVLIFVFAMVGSAVASGEPSDGKMDGMPSADKSDGAPSAEATPAEAILETGSVMEFPSGITIKEGMLAYGAEDGSFVVMTVDGKVVTQAPGTYTGLVVFEAQPLTTSSDGNSTYQTQSILTSDQGVLTNEVASALNGTYDENGITGADITADQANMSIVTVINSNYAIADSTFSILQTGNHASGGNDFTGDGCAISVTGGSLVTIDNVTVTGDGVTRTCLYGGLSTRDNYPTVYVANSTFTSTGDPEGEDCAVWVLGLHGVVRTCQFCDYYDIYYLNTIMDSYGWACLSVDGTEDPYPEDLEELNAAYVEGKGYANADGSIMSLAEFAVAATGLTDEYLAELAAVESNEDMQALPQTNDYSLYYFAGKNTLVNSELNILNLDTTGTGYSSYSIGANINVYSGCVVNASYGNVEANEYASSAYVNGTVVNVTKSIVMSHSTAGGITYCADSTLNAGEIAFIYKGTAGGMMGGPTGADLYVRNCKIDAPVLVLAFDSDDPGSLGSTEIVLDDSIAPKDTSFDVTEADNWAIASTVWSHGATYTYNQAVQAYFQDCTGETALVGDIYNCHQYSSKNLVVTLDNSTLTGAISSGWAEHDVDVIMQTMSSTEEDYVGEDGLRYGNRENLGAVTCTASETVNNGVILTLVNGAVWNVTETCYLSGLTVDATSEVNGTVTELGDGLYRVDPAEGGAKDDGMPADKSAGAPAASGDDSFEEYKDYVREQLAADGGPDEFKEYMYEAIDTAEGPDSENFNTLIEFGICVSYANWSVGNLVTSGAPIGD